MKCRSATVVAICLLSSLASGLRAAEPPSRSAEDSALPPLFDPTRHMRVSEVRPGMKGYGLSVFSGTKIERFDVEVIDILRKFNPSYDVVLIKAKGQNLEHTGSVAGMSGSPIFLKDDQGRERMIGAFAYGWPLTKDPLAGVQPIEYMLRIRTDATVPPDGGLAPAGGKSDTATVKTDTTTDQKTAGAKLNWSLTQSPYFPRLNLDALAHREGELSTRKPLSHMTLVGSGDVPQLQPLATPLMTSGVSPELLKQVAPLFEAMGLTPLQSGGGGSTSPPGEAPATLAPGSVLAVPMILGDMEMTALGTTTEVLGDRVFGFGHPFNNEGPVSLPMGAGRVSTIIPNLTTSFKLGAMTVAKGKLTADQSVGVGGLIGNGPSLVPIDFTVTYADGSVNKRYHFDAALHPRFTPLICGLSMMAALSGAHEVPPINTVDYDVKIEFANGEIVNVKNRAANTSAMEIFQEVGMPLMTAADNPFERVMVKKVSGTFKVSNEARDAQIVEVNLPKTRLQAGETVKVFVTYKPFRSEEQILSTDFTFPPDLPEGNYQLVVGDFRRYTQDEVQSRPFRFTAERADELFAALRDIAGIRRDALYLRLVRQPDGVAVGRTAMPQLPSSRRTVIMGAGRTNTTRFVSSAVKTVPTGYVMNGAGEFTITVDPKAKVGLGKPAPVKVDAGSAKDAPQKSEPAATPVKPNDAAK
jgi:hypothetical protein